MQFMDYIADDYGDEYHANRRAVLRTLMVYFRRNSSVHVFTRVGDIEVAETGQQARVSISAAMAPAEACSG